MTDTTTIRRVNWTAIYLGATGTMGAILVALLVVAPRKEGALDWFSPMIQQGWMAWTLPVAIFFWAIASVLVAFTILAIRFPETPRIGILRIETTRGDRLFISLLGSAFIHLIWLFFAGTPLWGALRTLPCLCRGGLPLGLKRATPTAGGAAIKPSPRRYFKTKSVNLGGYRMRLRQTTTAMALALMAMGMPAWADMEAAKAFLDAEIGDLSSLSRADQEAEMQWFVDAAAPYAGMDIKVVSETITTHEYESKVLAPAFTAITGIKITHDLIGEGDVVEKLQTQMQSGENVYDAYINDSDLIGTHWRYQQAHNLTDWMAGEGAAVTNPNLDLNDFIGVKFTTGPDGKVYQLPDQQFANLYWFRYDWFTDPKTMEDFKAAYGYDLGVPVNWSAYEDIAEFFTGRDMSYIGGPSSGVYGNMDYGKKDPSLGWRYTDAWMSMAGMGDVGEPNGLPVDEWGIRVDENSRPVGSCVARGGATNDAAAVYAVTKAIEWPQKFTPPEAQGMTFGEAGPVPAQGSIAQQMFWYSLHRRHGQARPAGDERGRHARGAWPCRPMAPTGKMA